MWLRVRVLLRLRASLRVSVDMCFAVLYEQMLCISVLNGQAGQMNLSALVHVFQPWQWLTELFKVQTLM